MVWHSQESSVSRHRLDRADVARHSIHHLAALEGRTGGAGGRHDAVLVSNHDLGVRANVEQHDHVVLLVHADGEEIGGYVSAHVAGNQRPAIDVRAREDAQAKIGSGGVDGGRVSLAAEHFVLDHRLVRLLPD